jgi:hypothetical protein
MSNCNITSLIYSQYNNSVPGNCIDGANGSSYDLPGKNKRVPIGEMLTLTRSGDDNVILCKLYSGYSLSAGEMIGWSANNNWQASTGTIRDMIRIGNIARVVL